MKIFSKNKENKYKLPNRIVNYPSGTCIETENGRFFVKDSARYKIPTQRILDSWNFARIIKTSESSVKLPVKGIIGFREGTLIKNIFDGKMYIVSGLKLRQIATPDWLEWLNYSEGEVLLVSNEEVNYHKIGEVL